MAPDSPASPTDAHFSRICRLCLLPFKATPKMGRICRRCYNDRRNTDRARPEVRAQIRATARARWATYRRTRPKRAAKPYVPRRELVAQDPKIRVRMFLTEAVKTGRIVKPTNCSDCGVVVPKSRMDGHHEDYNKPYDVIWLCRACHARRHWK